MIFYDYDEICLLTDCNFREMPSPRHFDEEMAAEPWFYVGTLFPQVGRPSRSPAETGPRRRPDPGSSGRV